MGVFSLALASAAAAQVTCPTYLFISGCTPSEQRSIPADSVGCTGPGGHYCRTAYDLRQGYYAFDEVGYGTAAILFDNDSLRIEGPPPGTLVTFRLHARVQCGVDVNPVGTTAGFDFLVQLGFRGTEGLEDDAIVNPGDPAVTFDREHDVVVTRPAGTTFDLYTQWRGGGGSNSRVWMRATVEILDLPPDARLVSCRGLGDVPTPTRTVSWGALKQRYR